MDQCISSAHQILAIGLQTFFGAWGIALVIMAIGYTISKVRFNK